MGTDLVKLWEFVRTGPYMYVPTDMREKIHVCQLILAFAPSSR